MFNTVLAFLRETKEWREWDKNAITVGFLLVMITSAIEVFGLGNQIATLWSPETTSVKGVSISMKLIATIYYFAAFNRGLATKGLGLTIAGGTVAVMHIPLVIWLWRINGFGWHEWIIALVSFGAIILSFVPSHRAFVFKGISTAIGGALLLQPIEMFVKQTADGLNPLDPFGFLVSCLVWVFYGTYMKDRTIAVFSVLYACIYAITLGLWVHYR